MAKYLFKSLKILAAAIAVMLILALLYLFAARSLSLIIVNKKDIENEDEIIAVYILSNGMHTDVVVPAKNNLFDWTNYFNYANTRAADSTFRYIAIGWGDRVFYLDIPEWSDLTLTIAFKAGMGLSQSAYHVTYYRFMYENEYCKKIMFTKTQYNQLVDYIFNYLKLDEKGSTIPIFTNAVYGNYDSFYEADKSYSILFTCNTWANNLLKTCGQKACLWTPFSSYILNLY